MSDHSATDTPADPPAGVPGGPSLSRYEGLCEASAAVALDAQRFAVASDELEALTVYRRGSKSPIGTVVFSDVTDLEAAARIGDTIFWITSHSLNKHGKDKPKRRRLLATAVAADGTLAPCGTVFHGLRAVVAQTLGRPEAALAADLDIEGLAATASGALLAGLRSPLQDGMALVVRIDDPFGLVGLATPPAPEAPVAPGGAADPGAAVAAVSRLDLGGLGVRSLERVGDRYLVVAGSVADGDGAPKLYWWDGATAVAPGPAVSFAGGATAPRFVAEALFAWDDGTVQILGDNGEACSEDAAERWFPSLDLTP